MRTTPALFWQPAFSGASSSLFRFHYVKRRFKPHPVKSLFSLFIPHLSRFPVLFISPPNSYGNRDRALTPLLLKNAKPRSWNWSWQDGESFNSYDQFVSNDQHHVR